jgi:Ca2+ transporting ATPase
VAVPEGLPLAVTIALAYSVGKMKEENNLVRYLQACETMGGADNICSDKTGTLTKNIMSVTRLFALEKIWTEFKPGQLGDFGKLLSVSICQNSNATPELIVEGDKIRSNQIGNKTECALLEMALRLGFNYK